MKYVKVDVAQGFLDPCDLGLFIDGGAILFLDEFARCN
jgi:hypothetical protein